MFPLYWFFLNILVLLSWFLYFVECYYVGINSLSEGGLGVEFFGVGWEW